MAATQTKYRKVELIKFPQSVSKVKPENKYWNEFKPKYHDTLHSNIPFLRFAATDPYDCIVCSSFDVRLFRSSHKFQTYKKLGFQQNPLSADLRRDTKLLAVGGKNGLLRIYNNAQSSGLAVMRSLKGHFGDVHDIKFQPSDNTRIVSFCGDKTCGYWDIVSTKRLVTIKGHQDYIRCGDWLNHYNNDNSNHCIISGSYDHLCKLWDLRDIKTIDQHNNTRYIDNIHHKSELQFDHGLPIQSCLSIPNSDLIAIAGGPKVTVWSIRKPNIPLTTIKVHRKSVTCLTTNNSGSRLLTGCLDNYVRVFTTSITGDSMFQNSHYFNVSSPVLSLSMCVNDEMIAVGTLKWGIRVFARRDHKSSLDRYLQLQQYENDPIAKYDHDIKKWMQSRNKLRYMTETQVLNKEKHIAYGTKRFMERGKNLKVPKGVDKSQLKKQTQELQMDDLTPTTMLVRFQKTRKMKQYNLCLKDFRYRDALDVALKGRDPLIVHSVLEDLWRRDGLEVSLGGRDSKSLSPILEYLIYALPHPHLSQTTLHITAIVIDLYQSIIGLSDDIDYLFKTIDEMINNMVIRYKILLKLQGSLDMILSAQDVVANPVPQKMLNLAEKINKIMEKTRFKFESQANDEVDDNDNDDDDDDDDDDMREKSIDFNDKMETD